MKKLLLCILLASFGLTSNAQDLKFGIKAGANVASFDDRSGSRVGLNAGVFAELPLSEKFSIQPELLYSEQGSNTTEWDIVNLEYFEFEDTFKIDYIILPVLAKYYVFDNFSIDAGPQVGYLINAKYIHETRGEDSGTQTETTDFLDSAEKIELSAAFGVSYNLPFNFTTSVRYTMGITRIDSNVKNNVIQLSIGYNFL